MNIYIYS